MIALPRSADTEALGERIARALLPGDVVALFGDLGMGKTTLARGLLRGLGFADEVASPTFPIVLPYDPPAVRLPLWHVDLYRIERFEEIEELALGEMLGEGALLIEWPDRMGAHLWRHSLRLTLTGAPEGGRCLTAGVPPAWGSRWPPR